ncbi:MAG TPA: ATP-binding protein, partial [Allocoleopsis sp.]
ARLIYQSGRHLILIVNDMLDLTRIETGQLELTLGSVTIESVCLEAYNQAQQSHVREDGGSSSPGVSEAPPFRLEIQPGLSSIVADELRLRQMLGNLLSNALKFTEPEGEIGLRVEQWEGWIAFTVWDTGIGIPAEKQHLIFQKFQQLETPLTRQFEGTGLGLVLTQRLARLHGGDVTFTSIEGEGSQFTLLLPPSPPQASTGLNPDRSPVTRIPAITAENRLVLIVETTPKRIEELSHQLVHLGYRIAIARSGTEALEKSRRLQPGVVFLAPMLPMLSGWDVLTLLKADETTRHIPVVVTASRGDRAQAYQSGANFWLDVPIQLQALQRCLERFTHQAGENQERSTNLTVLYLHSAMQLDMDGMPSNHPLQDLNALLHPYHCRVLEVDDLEQADLLAKVWQPHVTLINGIFADPFAEMRRLSQSPALAKLPLVTLTPEITHAANLVPGLMVFPYLSSSPIAEAEDSFDVSALWQAIQMAVGIHWTPHLLIADMAVLEENWAADAPSDLSPRIQSTKATSLGGIQALIHYLQIAGYRCSMGQTWQEVLQQLEHRSVDLLVFCVHTPGSLHLFLEIVQALEQLGTKPPIVVWNCQTRIGDASRANEPIYASEFSHSSETDISANIATMWGTIAAQILPSNISMPELLAQINQLLSAQ